MSRQVSEMKNFLENLDEISKQLVQKENLLFLDYDGTLTPIVATPDQAVLSDQMRDIIRKLCSLYKVAIVSGRATDDVRSKVDIDGIFYAGSHGFEIVQPDGKVEINQEAKKIQSVIDEVHAQLTDKLKNIKGALVEHVKYTISTHYRLVADEDYKEVKSAVKDILNKYPMLRKTDGKKVFEIRPRIDWDKGKAVSFILNVLHFNADKQLAIYIGDDTTDEDAFAALEGKGFGILVAEHLRKTKAQYWIRNTEEVKQVLEYFIEVKQ